MTEEQIKWLAAKLVEAEYMKDIANDNNNVSDSDYMEGLVDAYAITLAKLAPAAHTATTDAIKEYRDNKWDNYVPQDKQTTEGNQ